jgi:hypothetical protein
LQAGLPHVATLIPCAAVVAVHDLLQLGLPDEPGEAAATDQQWVSFDVGLIADRGVVE